MCLGVGQGRDLTLSTHTRAAVGHTLRIPALGRLRQEDQGLSFQATPSYIVAVSQKQNNGREEVGVKSCPKRPPSTYEFTK